MKLKKEDWSFENAQTNAKKISVCSRNAHLFKQGDRVFNFVIETKLDSYQSITTQGLKVYLDTFVLENGIKTTVLVFNCTEIAFFDAFIEILNRIIADSDTNDFEARARQVIQTWIRFYQKPLKPKLTDSLILGLLGELHSIKDLLVQGVDREQILEAWTGPDQESKDFSFDSIYLETKASKKTKGHVHKINGVDQLDPGDKTLFLSSYHFIDGSEGDCTINSLIKELNIKEFSPYGLEIAFYDKLYAYGYDRRDEISYDVYSFRLNSTKHFKIDNDFPKITHSSFITPLDFNVSSITYEVELNSVSGVEFKIISNEIH